MVDTHRKLKEVEAIIALYKMSLTCAISLFLHHGKYCQLNKHQFHANNTTVNERSLAIINRNLTKANLCLKKLVITYKYCI